MKSGMNINKASEMGKDRTKWRTLLSAYLYTGDRRDDLCVQLLLYKLYIDIYLDTQWHVKLKMRKWRLSSNITRTELLLTP